MKRLLRGVLGALRSVCFHSKLVADCAVVEHVIKASNRDAMLVADKVTGPTVATHSGRTQCDIHCQNYSFSPLALCLPCLWSKVCTNHPLPCLPLCGCIRGQGVFISCRSLDKQLAEACVAVQAGDTEQAGRLVRPESPAGLPTDMEVLLQQASAASTHAENLCVTIR